MGKLLTLGERRRLAAMRSASAAGPRGDSGSQPQPRPEPRMALAFWAVAAPLIAVAITGGVAAIIALSEAVTGIKLSPINFWW